MNQKKKTNSNQGFNTPFFLRSALFSYANKISLMILGLLYILIIANVLGPETFGVYSYLLDLAGTVLFLLGMEAFSEVLRVFIPKTNSRRLVRSILIIQFVIAFVLALGVFLFGKELSSFAARGQFIPFELLAMVVLFLPLSSLIHAMAAGNRQFGKLVLLSIVESLSNLVLAAVLIFGFDMGLVGVFIARIVSLIVLGIAGWAWLNLGAPNTTEDTKVIRSYGKQMWITTLFKKIGQQANLVYTGIFVSASALGFFYLLQKISIYLIETPLNSINEAVLPFASKTSDDVSLTEHLISRSIKFYLIFSVALAVVLLVLAPVVINLFFPLFSSGLELVPLFALYYALSFDFPMGTFFRVINKPRVLTITYISSAVVSLVPGYFLISHFLIQGLLATMVIARILGIMISIFFIRKSRYRIEFIPRKEDLAFFWLLFSRFFWQILRRFSRK